MIGTENNSMAVLIDALPTMFALPLYTGQLAGGLERSVALTKS